MIQEFCRKKPEGQMFTFEQLSSLLVSDNIIVQSSSENVVIDIPSTVENSFEK